MENATKTVIHIPKLNGSSIFVFIHYPQLFQNLTDLQQLFSPIKSYYWNVFPPVCNNFPERNCLNKPFFNNISKINHFSPVNNTVTNKITHLPQLFTIGPKIALKNGTTFYLDQPLPPNQIFTFVSIKMIIFSRVYCKL